VDGTFVSTKPEVITGKIISDQSILEDRDKFEPGRMKIARIEWCTEQRANRGRIVYLRSSVKPISGYKD
jgi:hypothetical protein